MGATVSCNVSVQAKGMLSLSFLPALKVVLRRRRLDIEVNVPEVAKPKMLPLVENLEVLELLLEPIPGIPEFTLPRVLDLLDLPRLVICDMESMRLWTV